MIKVGDIVKVVGTTDIGGIEKELIKINTICKVVGVENNEKNGLIVGIVPEKELPYNGYGEFWYLEKDVEKGHMEWVREG